MWEKNRLNNFTVVEERKRERIEINIDGESVLRW